MNARLLSPEKRRIYPNATTGAFIGGAGPLVKKVRGDADPGQLDGATWHALILAGWTAYKGPARTDARGWIVKGSDPGAGL